MRPIRSAPPAIPIAIRSGLTLEDFDTIGGHRTAENGQPIDVSTTIRNGPSITGAEGLGHYLHDNPKFPACMARKLFAYARGEDAYRSRPAALQDRL